MPLVEALSTAEIVHMVVVEASPCWHLTMMCVQDKGREMKVKVASFTSWWYSRPGVMRRKGDIVT